MVILHNAICSAFSPQAIDVNRQMIDFITYKIFNYLYDNIMFSNWFTKLRVVVLHEQFMADRVSLDPFQFIF